jgi:HK97 family phage portal protein
MPGILTRLFASNERSLENPSTPLSAPDDWLWDALGAHRASSGVNVNRETALAYASWWRAVNLVSKDCAKVPLHVYTTKYGKKVKDYKHPAYFLLRKKPNAEMSAFQFKLCMMMHVLSEGNGYAYIDRAGNGDPIELIPLQPTKTYPVRQAGKMYYITEIKTGEPRKLLPENVLHIKGLGFDGLVGYSVVSKARESLGQAMAADTFASISFRNRGEPGVVLEHPGRLSPEARKNLRESWERMHSGLENSHKTAILEEGMKVNPFSISQKDAQLLQSRQHSKAEVADWFGIPPHKLGILEGQAYNSLEQENESYLESCLDPWFVTWEEECDDKLLTETQKIRDTHLFEFERRRLVRADRNSRTTYYHNAIADGWMCRDEVRAEEGLNPIPDGKGAEYLVPLNMAPAGGETGTEAPAPAGAEPTALIEVPDIRQPDHYSCGACAAMCVGRYFGVGPESLDEWKAALGTDVQQSTKPLRIVEYLSSLGLKVTAAHNLTLDDLRRFWRAGQPVICCVQDFGPFIPGQAQFDYGHYLTVIGVSLGYVFCQDSSQDNVALPEYGDDAALGRVMIAEDTWLKNWHDRDIDGNTYVQFGIAVGTDLLPEVPPDDEDLNTPDDEAEGKVGVETAHPKQPEISTDPDGQMLSDRPRSQLIDAHRRLIGDVVIRMVKRIGLHARRTAKDPRAFGAWLDAFAGEHYDVVSRAFAPAVEAFSVASGRQLAAGEIAALLFQDLRAGLLEVSGRVTADKLAQEVDQYMLAAEAGELDFPSLRCLFGERHIVKEGDKWKLYSKDGKKLLGTFDTKAEAEKHEEQVNYFKEKEKKK